VTNPRRRQNTWYEAPPADRHREAAKSSEYYQYLSGKKAPRKSVQKRLKGKKVGWSWGELKKEGLYSGEGKRTDGYGSSSSERTGALRDLNGLIADKVITKAQALKLIEKKGTGTAYATKDKDGRLKKKGKLAKDVARLLAAADKRKKHKSKADRKSKTQKKLKTILKPSSARVESVEDLLGLSNPGRKTVRRRRNTRKTRINKLRMRLRRNALKINRKRKRKTVKKTAWMRFTKKNAGKGWSMAKMADQYRKSKKKNPTRKRRKVKRKTNSSKKRRMNSSTRRRTATRRRAPARRRNPIRATRRRIVRRRRSNAGGYGALMSYQGGSSKALAGKGMRLIGDVTKEAKKIPVLKYAAWMIAPIALGAAVAMVHRTVEPRLIPALAESKIPGAKMLAKAPYLTTGALVGASLIGLSSTKFGKKIISTPTAAKIGALAVATGVFADMFLPSLVKAAADVAREEAAAMAAQALTAASAAPATTQKGFQGYGDGGFYMIGANTRDLGQKAYADANYADAQMASAHMTPDEVSAAMQGAHVYLHVFPGSPIKLQQRQKLHSRHAGRKGHRYGWLIKMVGFDAFQKIAALPPQQRSKVIARLRQQALASVPRELAAAKQSQASHSATAMPLAGAANGAAGFGSPGGYGALMFAGSNH